jgi:hypothetical protein
MTGSEKQIAFANDLMAQIAPAMAAYADAADRCETSEPLVARALRLIVDTFSVNDDAATAIFFGQIGVKYLKGSTISGAVEKFFLTVKEQRDFRDPADRKRLSDALYDREVEI